MSETNDRLPWFRNGTGLIVLVTLSVFLGALVILPYLSYVLLAIVLAYILMPAQRELEAHLSDGMAAATLVLVAILAILLPVAYLVNVAISQAREALAVVEEGTLSVDLIESYLEDLGIDVDLEWLYTTYQAQITNALERVGNRSLEFVGGIPELLIGFTVMLFVLFTLLRDGDRLVRWSRTVAPIRDDVQRQFLTELDRLMWASVVGNVVVAVIQAVALAIGLAIVGVPALIFLTVTTFVFALLPLIGAFGVWLPVSIYLVAVGRPLAGGFVFLYGSVVSVSDMYLRPALIGRSSAYNAATVVVGIFGGLVVFGGVGLFVGPVVLGGAKVALDIVAREQMAEAPA